MSHFKKILHQTTTSSVYLSSKGKIVVICEQYQNVLQVCEGNILSGDLELPRHDKKFNWATFNELHNLLPHKKED